MKKRVVSFVILHICFWIFNTWREHCDCRPLWVTLLVQLFVATIFYFNYWWLVPKLFKRHTPTTYLIWAVSSFSLFCIGPLFARQMVVEKEVGLFFAMGYAAYMVVYYGGTSVALRFAYDLAVNEEQNRSLQLQKMTTQIQIMKSNVNLSFVVEALGHLESLALKDPESVKEPLLQLSNVLRYGTYHAVEQQIEVGKEIGVIEEYIGLVNQMEKDYRLQLQTSELQESTPTVPNLMVKLIAFWRQQLSHLFVGDMIIRISSTDNASRLILPACDQMNEHSLALHYPEIHSSLFRTNYFYDASDLVVEIKAICL